jgi:tetratricopeptide (TPR) repeat protein
MQRISVPVILAGIAAAVSAGPAADQSWTHLRTENFEMYTTAGEKRGRETILYFEQVRALFSKVFPSAPSASQMPPVRIVAFRGEEEFAPFRPRQAAAAYYSSGLERDYIVMQSISPEHYPIAVHEYMHRVVHGMGLDLPVWLNEGLAELFATLQPKADKVLMGRMDARRAELLRTNRMIPFEQFLAVDVNSPFYNERDMAGMFYAQSFALAHMLYYGDKYMGHIGKLEHAYQTSKDPAAVFSSVYGRSLETVQHDLEAYMRQDKFFYGIANVKLEPAAETVVSRPADDYDTRIMIADLYRISKNWAESARMYGLAAQASPNRPEAEEGLGWLEMNQNRHAEALPHFVRAIGLGSKSPLVCENAGRLTRDDPQRALSYMRRAVELDPELKDGNLHLGELALNAHEPQLALDALSKIRKQTPDRASELFRALARAYLGLNNLDEARKNAELAKQYSKTEQDSSSAQDLLSRIARREPGNRPSAAAPVPAAEMPHQEAAAARPLLVRGSRRTIAGILVEVVCLGKQARMTVASDGGSKSVFLIDDPNRVEFGKGGEFSCGPQARTRVTIGYLDPPESSVGIAGIVRSIEFVK